MENYIGFLSRFDAALAAIGAAVVSLLGVWMTQRHYAREAKSHREFELNKLVAQKQMEAASFCYAQMRSLNTSYSVCRSNDFETFSEFRAHVARAEEQVLEKVVFLPKALRVPVQKTLSLFQGAALNGKHYPDALKNRTFVDALKAMHELETALGRFLDQYSLLVGTQLGIAADDDQ